MGRSSEKQAAVSAGDVEAEVNQSLGVGGEGVGVELAVAMDVRSGGRVWVGEPLVGLREEVLCAAGAAFGGKRDDGNGWLAEIALRSGEDAVVVDGGDVGVRRGASGMEDLRVEQTRGEECECGGEECAAREGHDRWPSAKGIMRRREEVRRDDRVRQYER